MKIIDLECARTFFRIVRETNEDKLKQDLEQVAALPKNAITRRERERLFVRRAISHLPQNTRMIVFLKFWEGETIGEISHTLKLPFEQVRCEYIAALSYLERMLKPYILDSSFFMGGTTAA